MKKSKEVAIKSLQNLTKTDPDTGKFVNAQKFGRNISIGILIFFTGVLYIIGGLTLVLIGFGVIILSLVLISILLYIIIRLGVV